MEHINDDHIDWTLQALGLDNPRLDLPLEWYKVEEDPDDPDGHLLWRQKHDGVRATKVMKQMLKVSLLIAPFQHHSFTILTFRDWLRLFMNFKIIICIYISKNVAKADDIGLLIERI